MRNRYGIQVATLFSLFLSAARVGAQGDQPETSAGGLREGILVVTHAGAGTPPELSDGPQAAADSALVLLLHGRSGLDAAIEATRLMEDDCRFNAGTGANIRLDGKTIQMDAALMTWDGRFAAVGAIERVENPILVTRAVLDTPHLFLVGEGATSFAHNAGFEDIIPSCPDAERKYERRIQRLREAYGSPEGIEFDWRRYWNFPGPMPEDMKAWGAEGGTVGAVVRDGEGRFAATLSTGGTSITLYGRVGDVPVYGAGLYAGPAGAVACTGHGEEIIQLAVARSIHERMESGVDAEQAVSEMVNEFPEGSSIGIIAVDVRGWSVVSNRKMAFGVAGS